MHSKRFYKQLEKKELPTPHIFELMTFRMPRDGIKRELNNQFKDYTYYNEKGWFESDFYYPVKLNLVKKIGGKLFDKKYIKRLSYRYVISNKFIILFI